MSDKESILITGGCGFLGVKLAELILDKSFKTDVILADIARGPRLDSLKHKVRFIEADLSDSLICRELITPNISTIFHLASLVSGGAEQDFEAGMKANVYATIYLLEACRLKKHNPKFIFTSSIAVFGGERLPDEVTDWTYQHPQNSYGAAKAISEQLLNDYSRKGYVDGRGVRFAAIAVRDVPNTALSGYVSALCREPLNGRDYVCPVRPETRIPVMGVGRVLEFLLGLKEIKADKLGDYRTINGGGISPSASEILEAVRGCASSDRPLGEVRFDPDPTVQKIIDSWSKWMKADRARSLGLLANDSIEAIVQDYLRSDLTSQLMRSFPKI